MLFRLSLILPVLIFASVVAVVNFGKESCSGRYAGTASDLFVGWLLGALTLALFMGLFMVRGKETRTHGLASLAWTSAIAFIVLILPTYALRMDALRRLWP